VLGVFGWVCNIRAHIIMIWYRPINKFDGLHDSLQTKQSVNYRPTA
jgi:hypothetical protein